MPLDWIKLVHREAFDTTSGHRSKTPVTPTTDIPGSLQPSPTVTTAQSSEVLCNTNTIRQHSTRNALSRSATGSLATLFLSLRNIRISERLTYSRIMLPSEANKLWPSISPSVTTCTSPAARLLHVAHLTSVRLRMLLLAHPFVEREKEMRARC